MSAAFVMAEMLQVDYTRIAISGVLPALAFYAALFLSVDLQARKTGIGTIPVSTLSDIEPLLPRLYLLAPPAVLVGLLVAGYSATYSAVVASIGCVLLSFVKRDTWLVGHRLAEFVETTTRQASQVAIPIAAIGIIIAVAVQSNLALKFSSELISASGSTVAAMGLIVIGCIVMGMGLPTVAAYLIGAILFVPALKELGVQDLPAHFFVMYYCVLSMVTPPVALASYAAAGISGGSAMRTSARAFQLGLVCFLIPFAFAFEPELLGRGELSAVLISGLSMLIGTAGWAVALGGLLAATPPHRGTFPRGYGRCRRDLHAYGDCALGLGHLRTCLVRNLAAGIAECRSLRVPVGRQSGHRTEFAGLLAFPEAVGAQGDRIAGTGRLRNARRDVVRRRAFCRCIAIR